MEEVKIDSGVLNDGRRFSFVVENVTTPLMGDGIILSGTLHGTMKKDDEAYLMVPGRATMVAKAKIKTLEAGRDAKFEIVEEATNTDVQVILDVDEAAKPSRYSVVTSVGVVEKVDPKTPMENPFLTALLFDAQKFSKDKTFAGLIYRELTHATYVVPVKLGEKDEKGQTKVGFNMLPAQKPEEGKMPTEFLFPVFTNHEQLSHWKAIFTEGSKTPVTLMRFKNILDIIKPEQTKGFIINPFSTNLIVVSKPLIEAIVNSEGYKRDFPEAQANAAAQTNTEN